MPRPVNKRTHSQREVEEEEEEPRRRRCPQPPEDELDGMLGAMHLRQQADAPAAAAADEIPIEDPLQPCPRDDIDWSQWKQDPNDPITDPDFCLWSVMGRTDEELSKNQHWQTLLDYHRLNRGDQPAFPFCREMQRLYNTRIRDHLVDMATGKTKRGPAWPPQNIYYYTFKVRRTPNAFVEDVMHTFFEIAHVMQKSQLFQINTTTGQKTADLKAVDMYIKMTDKAYKWINDYRSIKTNRLHAPN